jgi:hypothetical protein
MKRALLLAAALSVSACSSAQPRATIPSLSGGTTTHAHGGYSPTRVSQLHAAAQCIRSHGVPTYQDPVLTANGQLYTDARSFQDLGKDPAHEQSVVDGIRQACGSLIATVGFQPADEAPAPPQLVQAGVRAAGCLRSNGLPNYRDPTSSTPFTPGHGFGLTADELPNNGALGKQDPAVQRAFTACRALLDEEIRQSDLTHLAHD